MITVFKNLSKKDVWIDALRNGRVAVEHVRNKPNITLNSSILFPDSDIFKGSFINLLISPFLFQFEFTMSGEKHTLLLVQPDVSMVNPMSGQVNDAEVTVFWMVHDLVEGNISNGTERLSYLGMELFMFISAFREFYRFRTHADTAKTCKSFLFLVIQTKRRLGLVESGKFFER